MHMLDSSNPSNDTRTTPRSAIHEVAVHFRAKETLVSAAKALSAERGMSLAEFMRHALRREIDASNATANKEPDHGGKLSAMDTSVRRAARGDTEAQRQEILNALIAANTHPTLRYEGLRLAEHWARMAALTGSGEDHARLLSVLGLRIQDCTERGDTATAQRLESETIGIVSVLADEGDEYCASILNSYAREVAPELMQGAKAFVQSWQAAV